MEACAYQLAACGREKMRVIKERDLCRARFVIKEHSRYDFEVTNVVKMPFPMMNREFLGRYAGVRSERKQCSAGCLVVAPILLLRTPHPSIALALPAQVPVLHRRGAQEQGG